MSGESQNFESIEEVVKYMANNDDNPGIQLGCLELLGSQAKDSDLKQEIADCGGIETIIHALTTYPTDRDIIYQGFYALRNLASHNTPNKIHIVSSRGYEAIVTGMRSHPTDEDVQRRGVEAIWIIAVAPATKVSAVATGALNSVLTAMTAHRSSATLQRLGCAALQNISDDSSGVQAVLSAGGAGAVLAAMEEHEDDARVQSAGCAALRNMADDDSGREALGAADALHSVVLALHGHMGDAEVVEVACAALANLTRRSAANTRRFFECSGAEHMVLLLEGDMPAEDADVAAYILETLANVTRRAPGDQFRVSSMLDYSDLVRVASAHGGNAYVVRIAFKVLRNILGCPDAADEFIEAGGHAAVLEAMTAYAREPAIQKLCAEIFATIFAVQVTYDASCDHAAIKAAAAAARRFPASASLKLSAAALQRSPDPRVAAAHDRMVCTNTIVPQCSTGNDDGSGKKGCKVPRGRCCPRCCITQKMFQCYTCDGRFSRRLYCYACTVCCHKGHYTRPVFCAARCASEPDEWATPALAARIKAADDAADAKRREYGFPLTLSATELNFDLGTHQPEVLKEYREDIVLTNTSGAGQLFAVECRTPPGAEAKYKLRVTPTQGFLQKGEGIKLRATLTFDCSTTADAEIEIAAWAPRKITTPRLSRRSPAKVNHQHRRRPSQTNEVMLHPNPAPTVTIPSTGGDEERKDAKTATIKCFMQAQCSQRIDPDEIALREKPLGEGSYGIVYRGRYRSQDVAVKVPKDQTGEKSVRSFRKEAAIWGSLHHPNILSFVGASWIPGRLSFVSEHCPLGNLSGHLKDPEKAEAFSYTQRLRCLYDMAQGLGYLHMSGIMHRDVKPGNALLVSLDPLAPAPMCKIADMGFTKAQIRDAPKLMTRCGTPIYEAPEILNELPYTKMADVYSFSMTMVHLITGLKPYKNEDFPVKARK